MAKAKAKPKGGKAVVAQDLLAVVAKLLVVYQTTELFQTSDFLHDLNEELSEVLDDDGDEDEETGDYSQMDLANLRGEVVKKGLLSKKKAEKTSRKKLLALLAESNENEEGNDEDEWQDED